MFGRRLPARTVAQRMAMAVDEQLRALVNEQHFIVLYWNMYRDKTLLMDTLATSWHQEKAADLLSLTPQQLVLLDAFFAEVQRFAQWARFTEAMPATLEGRYDAFMEKAQPLGQAAIGWLGGVPEPAPDPVILPGWGSLRR